MKLVAKEERAVLRSVLTVPAFLSGIADDQLAEIRTDAARAIDPERYARVESLRRGRDSAEKAITAAVRAIEDATAP